MGKLATDAKCPYCKKDADGFSHVDDIKPTPGDYVICAYCCEVGCYTDSFQIRKINDDDIKNINMKSLLQAVALLKGMQAMGAFK